MSVELTNTSNTEPHLAEPVPQTTDGMTGAAFAQEQHETSLDAALTGIAATLQHQTSRLGYEVKPLAGSAEAPADARPEDPERAGVFYDKVTQRVFTIEADEDPAGGMTTYTATETFGGPGSGTNRRLRSLQIKARPQEPADHEFVKGRGDVREIGELADLDEELTRAQPVPAEVAKTFIEAHASEPDAAIDDGSSTRRYHATRAIDKAADVAYLRDAEPGPDGKPLASAADIRTPRERRERIKTTLLVGAAATALVLSAGVVGKVGYDYLAGADADDAARSVSTDRGASAERPDNFVDVSGDHRPAADSDGQPKPGTVETFEVPRVERPDPGPKRSDHDGVLPGVTVYYP